MSIPLTIYTLVYHIDTYTCTYFLAWNVSNGSHDTMEQKNMFFEFFIYAKTWKKDKWVGV